MRQNCRYLVSWVHFVQTFSWIFTFLGKEHLWINQTSRERLFFLAKICRAFRGMSSITLLMFAVRPRETSHMAGNSERAFHPRRKLHLSHSILKSLRATLRCYENWRRLPKMDRRKQRQVFCNEQPRTGWLGAKQPGLRRRGKRVGVGNRYRPNV